MCLLDSFGLEDPHLKREASCCEMVQPWQPFNIAILHWKVLLYLDWIKVYVLGVG